MITLPGRPDLSGVTLRTFRRATLYRVAAVSALCLVTVAAGVWLADKSHYYGVPLSILPVVIALPAWLILTKRTGLALAALLLYMGLLDGYIKLRTGSQVATLGRDFLLYGLAIGMVMRAGGRFRLPELGGWLVAWVTVIVVQLANPANPSLSHAAASMRQDLEFVPLFFLGYVALRTRASLYTLFALLLSVAAINGMVAAYQTSLSESQLAAWGPGYETLLSGPDARLFDNSSGQTQVRPPALGSDEGFGGVLGVTALPGGIVLLIAYRRRRWLLALVVLGIIGAAVAVFTSQARSVIIMAFVAVLTLFALIAIGRQAGRAMIALILAGALAVAAVQVIQSTNSNASYRYSSITPGNLTSTLSASRSTTWSLTPKYIADIPFGAGLGLVGPAANKAGGTADANLNAESEFNYLIVESGVPGLLVMVGFQVVLFWVIVRGLRREADPVIVLLMAGLAAPLFAYAAAWFVGVYTTATPSAPYLWLSAGAISWWLIRRQRNTATAPSVAGTTRRVAELAEPSPSPA